MLKVFKKCCIFKLNQKSILFKNPTWRTVNSTKWNNFINTVNFHTSSGSQAKLFVDRENSYAHSILEKHNNYNLCTKPSQININEEKNIEEILSKIPKNSAETVENFKHIVNFCKTTETCISNEKFNNFVDIFTNNCIKFSDEELIECILLLSLLPQTHSVNTQNFNELWRALDDVCVHCLEDWSLEKILYVCDCWYSLNLARCCEFVWEATRKIGRRIRKLTHPQLVQTMFLCNIVRKPLIEKFEFEVNFDKIIDNLSLDEISVMSMGFFKTKTPIRNPELIVKIYKRLMKGLDTISDISLVNILKILRYSSKLPHADILNELLDKICPYINKMSMLSCLHVALLGNDIQNCHDKSLELIIERFNQEIESTRIKDMERIAHVMGLFNFESETGIEKELCSKIISNIKNRVDEIMYYPKCFSACLHYLTLSGFYDEELLSAALDQKFIKHAYGRNMLLGREIFCLDSYARINLKDSYSGNVLQDRQRRTMGKCLTHYLPSRSSKYKLSAADRIVLEVKETCEDLYRIAHMKQILPHFERPDIVICYDKSKNRALQLNETCKEDYTGTILSRDDIVPADQKESNVKTAVLVIGGWNNFVRKRNKSTGLLKLKLEQLEILGHKSILIPWYDWRSQETNSDRQNYIRRKLSVVI